MPKDYESILHRAVEKASADRYEEGDDGWETEEWIEIDDEDDILYQPFTDEDYLDESWNEEAE